MYDHHLLSLLFENLYFFLGSTLNWVLDPTIHQVRLDLPIVVDNLANGMITHPLYGVHLVCCLPTVLRNLHDEQYDRVLYLIVLCIRNYMY